MDPASGAALSERTTCETLAGAGWRVRVIATTSTEQHGQAANLSGLLPAGLRAEAKSGLSRRVWNGSIRGVHYQLLDTSDLSPNEARVQCSDDLDILLNRELLDQPPDLLLTYGSDITERRRRASARRLGVPVVFSLRNLAYKAPESFEHTDAVLTASSYVSAHYLRTHNLRTICLPVAIATDRVVCETKEPTFFTFVNPCWAKGAPFIAYVVRECLTRWPNMAFLIVESRGTGAEFARYLQDAGLRSDQISGIVVSRNTSDMRRVYAVTRVALVPSFVEPAGRIPVEAMLNGIPVVASDRGGLPEAVSGGGYLLPVCEDASDKRHKAAIDLWVDQLGLLFGDQQVYALASENAARHVERFRNGDVERQRLNVFEALASTLSHARLPV